MRQMKKIISIILILCLGILSISCGKEEHPEDSKCYTLYYVNQEYTKLITQEYWTQTTDSKELVVELFTQLTGSSEKLEYIAPVGGQVSLKSWSLNNGKLLMNFKDSYAQLSPSEEILTRAAIVKTLTQIVDVTYISFQVGGEALTDNLGNLVGAMFSDTFIYNEGAQINSFEEVTLQLYFADQSGKTLIPTSRNIMYNSNISMEKLVVEQLIAGPNSNTVYPTINAEARVLSVTVKDGICYVNFDETFLAQTHNVTNDVFIYSIVNSLCELSSVNKVQISINGQTDVTYRETVSFTTVFERNLDIVE